MKKIIGFFILGVTASSFTYPNNLPYKVEEIQKSNKKEIPYDLAEYKIILSDKLTKITNDAKRFF